MLSFGKLRIFALVFASILVLLPITNHVNAQTPEEIQLEINNQQNNLNKTKTEIQQLEEQIKNSAAALEGLDEGIPKLTAELENIDRELSLTQKKLQQLEEENKLKELEKKKAVEDQRGALHSSYQNWRLQNGSIFQQGNFTDTRMVGMSDYFSEKILEISGDDISILIDEIAALEDNISDNNDLVSQLQNTKTEVEKKKKEIEDQIAYYNSVIAYGGGQIGALNNKIQEIGKNIDLLSAAQSEALRIQAELASQNGGGGASVAGCGIYDDNNLDNNISICGLGDDFVQGHGVGMSQWGAYGGAQSGMNAEQILRFYYTGVEISNYSLSSEITIKYCPGDPVHDAYQNGCNGAGPVTERVSFDAYLAGLGEMPHSWPLEARKAQIIAARSYAVNYTNNGNPNSPICITAYCQVSYIKSGIQSENDAVQATKDLVITHGGQIIQAMYSADNSQGWGTADYETMFQDNYDGTSRYIPYLRAVNDSGFALKTSWTHNADWGYKTRTYSMNDINDMLDYVANNSGRFGGFSGHAAWMKGQLGGRVAKLTFERDASKRVRKVYFYTTSGSSSVMGGYWFTYMWNLYTADKGIRNSNGSLDWLWSQTFFLHIE